ncbi:GIY-YIG nuclease family protein [Terasakiella pusilla]|uniref:GIY-YIG nuclease family protein n=1 Tax=Terasakiella pusilla TaxID=64973 RepID=UPI003AA8FBD8
MRRSKTIKMFLLDGCPHGSLSIEIMNWTGQIFVTPRSQLPTILAKQDFHRTGLYFLFGHIQEYAQKTAIYVGESDHVANRLAKHNQTLDNTWDRVCIITSKDKNLTKSHVKYLESQLIFHVLNTQSILMLNKATPKFDSLPDSDLADMDLFLEHILTVLPLLNIHLPASADHHEPDPHCFQPTTHKPFDILRTA